MKKLGVGIGILLVVVCVVMAIGFAMPSDGEPKARIVIEAPAEEIFPLLLDFNEWGVWSDIPPQPADGVQWKTAGTPGQVGSRVEWSRSGTRQGQIELVRIDPLSRLEYELVWASEDDHVIAGKYELRPTSEGTEVAWCNYYFIGRNPFDRLWFAMAKDQIRRTFADGLARLKARVEQDIDAN